MTEAAVPPPSTNQPTPVAAPAAVTESQPAPPAALPAALPPATTRARRPGLDPATRRQTFIVAAVIAALFYGSQVLNEALPANAQAPLAAGESVLIGDGVRITPLEGWVATTHDNGFGIRLEKGVAVIDFYPESVGGNAGALAQTYLDEVLRPGATQLTTSDVETATTDNGTAARFAYQGLFEGVEVAIEGEVTAVFIGAQAVVADAWSRQGDLASLLGEVHAILETIEVAS